MVFIYTVHTHKNERKTCPNATFFCTNLTDIKSCDIRFNGMAAPVEQQTLTNMDMTSLPIHFIHLLWRLYKP